MSRSPALLALALLFAHLSLIAVGGANAVLPEMQRQVVDIYGWMSGTEFADLFALAQAAPGPNVLVVTLIGLKVGGFAGAIVATAAMVGPSSMLSFGMGKVWQRFRDRPWRKAVQAGMAPVTVGLVLASGYLLTDASDHGWPAYAVTAAMTLVVLFTRLNPLWMLGAAGLLGLAGLL